jgi:hypothetical protein
MASLPAANAQGGMIRLPTLFWLIAVSAAGFAMFAVKYEVQALADQLTRTVKQADEVERGIRAFDAEWAYLNRPDALAQMNQRFLSLAPIATKQLRGGVADLPMRPVPVPSPAPVETVATNAAPGTSATLAAPGASPMDLASNAPAPGRPSEDAGPVETAALDQARPPHPARTTTSIKISSRPSQPRRAASLNELIAQITESR